MDIALFLVSSVAAVVRNPQQRSKSSKVADTGTHGGHYPKFVKRKLSSSRQLCEILEPNFFFVDAENRPLVYPSLTLIPATNQRECWCRATYTLVMQEPPHMYHEPKDWSCTTILLLQPPNSKQLQLPGGPLIKQESYHDSAIRHLFEDTAIDVCLPENCLHHLFTFPFEGDSPATVGNVGRKIAGVWGDFYECIYRGSVQHLQEIQDQASRDRYTFVTMTLLNIQEELLRIDHEEQGSKDNSMNSNGKDLANDPQCDEMGVTFAADTLHALRLYFQRQGDLRVQRRLLKGYSSDDLEHYGLRPPRERPVPILRDFQDTERQAAVDFTLKTDDGMSPRLLPEADLVILGVSRAGKTPLSILIAQTMGLKVANVPLVLELDPPKALTDSGGGSPRHRGKRSKDTVDPRRVFCLTLQPDYLQRLRMTRLRRELKKQLGQGRSIYASQDYVEKDVQKAKDLCLTYGFTEVDVTGRAMEETASLILSKLKERFPDEFTRVHTTFIV